MNDRRTLTTQPPHHEPDHAIGAYALGLLDPDERLALEAHLAGCATCQADLARHEDVVGQLGYLATPVPPSPDVRAALLAEIRAGAASPATPIPPGRRVPVAWFAIAAAIAILSIAVLGSFLIRTIDERDDARHVQQQIAEYLSDGGTMSPLLPAPGAPPDIASGHGTLAVAPNQSGAMLIVYGLPPSTDELRYAAWAEGDGDRVELGELTVDEHGVGSLKLYGPEPIATYETIGITRFSPDAPDGEPFLIATVD